MSGNDIVDLQAAAAESNWRRKGFLQKLFTPQEQAYIHQSAGKDIMVWTLWSMKESAYKLYNRQCNRHFFAPQEFHCTLLTQNKGIVEYRGFSYHTTTAITGEYIYTIAQPAAYANASFINECFLLPQNTDTSQFIYNRIINRYASDGDKPRQNLVILKKNKIPFLYCGGNLQIPVSITHHGRFAAFTVH